MTGIIVTGGDFPEISYVREYFNKVDYVIAADSGLDALSVYGIVPDLVLGDLDSLKDRSLLDKMPDDKILEFPKDKDFTDTELALNYLNKKGCSDIILIGGGGGRLDHLIALYTLFSRDLCPFLWVTANEKIFLIKDKFSINLKKNSTVSFFPVSKNKCKMVSKGLKWELDGLNWTIGDSGVSNIALDETIIINMISGKLVMIMAIGEN